MRGGVLGAKRGARCAWWGRRWCGEKEPRDPAPLFMDEEVIVGGGFIAPTNPMTVAVKVATAAHNVPHDVEPFETE